MLREKRAPVMKNIHSRKPNFLLNTEKKNDQCYYRSPSVPFHVSTVIISPFVKTAKNMSLKIYSGAALVAYWLCSRLMWETWVQERGLARLLWRDRVLLACSHRSHPDHSEVSKHILNCGSSEEYFDILQCTTAGELEPSLWLRN